MKRICLIYNYAQHYRTGIFKLMDERLDCNFYFGDSMGEDVKEMDYAAIRRGRTERMPVRRFLRHLTYQQGVPSLLRRDYDTYIVFGDLFSLSTWLFLMLALFCPRKKVILWTHGWYGRESWLRRRLKRIYFGMADHVMTYGHYAKQLMLAQGFPERKLSVIHNSLDHTAQLRERERLHSATIYKDRFGNDDRVLLFVGRLTPQKKLNQLLDVLATLNQQTQHAHKVGYNLILIGDGEMRPMLEDKVRSLGLEARVWFYGACYDESVLAQLIYNADLCVSPGNVGLTAMHAMAFGCPVASHDSFAYQPPEFEAIREGVTGTFFRQNDVADMVRCIIRWFDALGTRREAIRQACYDEIDTQWTPQFQLKVIEHAINSVR